MLDENKKCPTKKISPLAPACSISHPETFSSRRGPGGFFIQGILNLGFTKLDEGILQSSIMAEDPATFKVWIALLATCKEDGIAHCSPVFLSSVCRLSEETVDQALQKLMEPDPQSRSKDKRGRRIRIVDGGFFVLNYEKYRAFNYSLKTEAMRKREYRKRLGEREGQNWDIVPNVPGHSASASASLFSSLKEGDRGGGRPEIKPAEFIDRKEEIKAIFDRRHFPRLAIPGRILDYITELTFEFPDVDWCEETEKKIAHLKDNPPGKHANLALQFRNWWANARRFAAERRRGDRVGTKDPDRERRMAKFKKEEEALEAEYRPSIELAKKEGRQNDLTDLLHAFTMILGKKKKELGL